MRTPSLPLVTGHMRTSSLPLVTDHIWTPSLPLVTGHIRTPSLPLVTGHIRTSSLPLVKPRPMLFHDWRPWAGDWWEAQKQMKNFQSGGWTQDLSQEINQYTHTHTHTHTHLHPHPPSFYSVGIKKPSVKTTTCVADPIMIFIAHSVSAFLGIWGKSSINRAWR